MNTKCLAYLALMMVLLIAVSAWAGSEYPNVYYETGAGGSNTSVYSDTFVGAEAGSSRGQHSMLSRKLSPGLLAS